MTHQVCEKCNLFDIDFFIIFSHSTQFCFNLFIIRKTLNALSIGTGSTEYCFVLSLISNGPSPHLLLTTAHSVIKCGFVVLGKGVDKTFWLRRYPIPIIRAKHFVFLHKTRDECKPPSQEMILFRTLFCFC